MTKEKERRNKIIKQIKENRWIHYFALILIGIILSIPLSQIQIRDTHDGTLHMLRLIGTMDTLEIGQFPPLINQNYCNEAGYAMNLFYPPLVTYLPLIIKLFIPTYSMVLKIFGAVCIILSGITMYQFVYQVTGKRSIAFFSSCFYLIAPYKLANVYKRFAIGEFTAMVFIPLVFLGLYNVFEQNGKKHYYIAIGAIGLMLSHTVTTLYTALFCVFYIMLHYKKLKEKRIIKQCIINGIFILLITMLFWGPLLETTISAEYAIMNDETMRTNGQFASQNTISFSQLWKDKGEENGTTFLLGIPTIITILLTIWAIKKVDNQYRSFYFISFLFAILSLFMACRLFPWSIMPDFLCKLQYPWRMVGFFNFFASFICGVNLYYILKQLIKTDGVRICIIIIFIMLSIINSIKIMSQFYTKDKTLDETYETHLFENKKISHKQINRDYMPIKALYLQNSYVIDRKVETYILQGKAEIIEEKKENLKDEISVKQIEPETILEFPYYYYPGYEIKITTQDSVKTIKPMESENGYLACILPEGMEEGNLTVQYVGTTNMYICYLISAISLFVFIIGITYERKKGEKND